MSQASSPTAKERVRLYWVDWLRTQSVWNVVCGHIWWSVRDKTKLDRAINIYQAPWTEASRMLEYVVDQGSFHTIPLFFLVSGYLTSTSFKIDNASLQRFFKNRFLRVWPPFVFGLVLLYIERAARGESVDILDDLLLSYLWFLWALALVQNLLLPYCIMVHMLVKGEVEGKKFAASAVCHVAVCGAVIGGFVVLLSGDSRAAWLAGLPAGTLVSLALFWAPGLTGAARDWCQVGGAAFMALSTLIFPAAHTMCPVSPDCGRYDWLTSNIVQGILLIILCQLAGFTAGMVAPQASRTLLPLGNSLAVGALLLSCYWPYFTYWAPQYIRRNAFMKTYQSEPTFLLGVEAGAGDDPAMEAGLAPAWGLARMWFWSIGFILFAKGFCDVEVSAFFHRHVTQSGMVLYLFHYLFIPAVIDALWEGGTTDPQELMYAAMVIVFALCFACYAVIVSNPFTARAFGIIAVDFKPMGWMGASADSAKDKMVDTGAPEAL